MLTVSGFFRRCPPRWRALCLTLAALCLSACASLLPPTDHVTVPERDRLQSFALEGRFSLRHEDKSYAGRLTWRHAGGKDELLLATPFGQGMAEIISDAAGARLTASDGKSYAAADAETLTRQVLGYPLPLSHLPDWVRGRAPNGDFEALDAFGRPLRLRQDGWHIEYEYDSEDLQALPGRLFIQRTGVLELRLRIDEWRDLRNGEAGHD